MQTSTCITHTGPAGTATTLVDAGGTGQTPLTFNVAGVGIRAAGMSGIPTSQLPFVANGDFGNVNWAEVDPAGGFTFGSLSVNRGGPTTDPQTSLSYFVFQCDPSSEIGRASCRERV